MRQQSNLWSDEGRRRDVVEVLETRFGTVPETVRERIGTLRGKTELKSALRLAAQIVSLDEFLTSI